MAAQIADRGSLDHQRPGRYLVLDGQIELFRVGRTEVRGGGEHPAVWFVCVREVGRLERQESITHPQARIDVSRGDGYSRSEGKLPEEPQAASLVTGRIVEYPKAAANHGVSKELVGKSNAGT